jgi:hypothetical protein
MKDEYKHEAWATAVIVLGLALVGAYTYLRIKGIPVP